MPSLTIEVPADVAKALEALDTPLMADEFVIRHALNWSVHQAHDELWALSEEEHPDPAELRALAARLVALADAYEAVKG